MSYKIKNPQGVKVGKILASVLITTFVISSFFVSQIFPVKAVVGEPDPNCIHIEGNVVNQQTQSALAGVSVKLLVRDPIDWYIYCENDVCENSCTTPLYQKDNWCYAIERETTTDNNGYYALENVDYCNLASDHNWYVDLEFSLGGYQTYTVENIDVACGQILTYNVELVQEGPEPVILIPGILGSWKRYVCWTDPYTSLYTCETKFVPDPIFQTYDNLWQALQNYGYVEQKDLFAFGYNWRKNNTSTAALLKQKIQEVKDKTGKDKVDLVTHSMGGLVARAYIQSPAYADDVDQLIFLGTPHLGSPNAYEQYEAVSGFEPPDSWIAIPYFTAEAFFHGYTDLVKYVQERVPALKELLPIYDYLKKKVNDVWEFRTYPTENYVQNTFLENLNVAPAVNLLKDRVRITNIVSDYTPEGTIVAIRTVPDPDSTDSKWVHGYPENYNDETTDRGLERGVGDHTVPMSSANGLPGVETIFCEGGPIHRSMPTECQRHVIQALKGVWPDEIYRASLIEKLLLIYVHSPVEFQVIDSEGKVTGYDFSSDNYFENISNSLFDEEYGFVFIKNPSDGEYKINLLGIESGGGYELVVNNINESGGQESSVSGTINPSQTQSYSFDYDNESTEPVVIEEVKEKVTFQSVRDKVREFYEQGLITKKSVKNYLIETLEGLEKKYNQLAKLKKQWQKEVWKKVIILGLEVEKIQIKYWHKKGLIKSPADNILISDFNSLIHMVKDLN